MAPGMRSLVAAVLAGAALCAPAEAQPAPVSAEQLLARARAARAQAESDLARARTRILAERKALAAELQKAYADLDAAGAEARTESETLRRLQSAAEGSGDQAGQIGERTRRVLARAAEMAGVDPDQEADGEALERQWWGGLQRRLTELDKQTRMTLRHESVIARDGTLQRLPVLRLGAFAAYACGADRQTSGLLCATPDGRWRVAGPTLDGEGSACLRSAVEGAPARLPLDVTQTLQDRPAAPAQTVGNWLSAGGVFLVPILVVGALGIVLILERVLYLIRSSSPPAVVPDVLAAVVQGPPRAARSRLLPARTPMARVLLAGVDALDEPAEQREAALESALLAEAPRLERSLSLLAALAGVAPLLGLLGTVSGMIATFDTISSAGTGNPRLLSGGISEALITTQVGLMVAIPLLLVHAWLSRWVQRREAMLEHAVAQIAGVEPSAEREGDDA